MRDALRHYEEVRDELMLKKRKSLIEEEDEDEGEDDGSGVMPFILPGLPIVPK